MEPIVTFIIPVYNTKELWLRRAVDSVYKQTNNNWELIIIDDGSEEQTASLCDELAKDNRVLVYHQKNGGVCSARNLGMDKATGSFIAFIDADDWIEETYVDRVQTISKEHKFDMMAIGHEDVWAEKSEVHLWGKSKIHQFDNSEKRGMQLICLCWYGHGYDYPMFFGAQWKIVYRRSFLNENGIRNKIGLEISEDAVFNLYAIEKADRILYLNEVLYHYYINSYSALNNYCNNVKRYQRLLIAYKEFIDRHNKDEEFHLAYENIAMIQFWGVLSKHFFHACNEDTWRVKKKSIAGYLLAEPYYTILKKNMRVKGKINHMMLLAMRLHDVYMIYLLYKVKGLRNKRIKMNC